MSDHNRYPHQETEAKWQKKWNDDRLYETDIQDSREKYYCLVMFPYPSGDKLHLGHWYNYAPTDTWGRFMRMQGYNVFEPMGFDSFGLPAENYAIKTGIHPSESTAKNIEYMRKQLSRMGTMYDWSKEVSTSSPDYYKWTQWVFLQLYKKGLAYQVKAPVNWCPSCMTVLANEQVQDGVCERCKSEVTKKDLNQWKFKISEYAEQLLDFSELDWPEKTIAMQKNWIGRKEGINITYKIKDSDESLVCFTTRPETNFGATFVVISPEHPHVATITTDAQKKAVADYIEETKKKSDIERANLDRKKTGVFTGSYAVNDLTGYEMPVYVADYVLMNFGTGVVVGVPAHDVRDYEFADAVGGIDVIRVIRDSDGGEGPIDHVDKVFEDDGEMINSEFLNGLHPHEAIPKMMDHMEEKGMGTRVVNYRLHDWLIARQRYWGAPIPMIYCKDCGEVPVPETDLPVLLPEVNDYKPKGKSPLATNEEFVNTQCPKCGGAGKREVDTMDTFVCSSWYFLRYPDAHLDDAPFKTEHADKWLPVDMYVGGPEHACMHLLYARFIHKVLHDMGFVAHTEPFKKLVHQGLITKDGAKMSKSKGNVVSPDEFVDKYGADVFRMYLMFMGPFTQGGDWNDRGITGIARFVDKFWKFILSDAAVTDASKAQAVIHKTIDRITRDIKEFQFNTCISAMMECLNELQKTGASLEDKKLLAQLIAPFAPHLGEELWAHFGETSSIFDSNWPSCDADLLVEDTVTIAVQVNGKVRGTLDISADSDKDTVIAAAKDIPNVQKHLEGVTIRKEIYVPGKLVSLVVG